MEFQTTEQAAATLRLKPKTLHNWRSQGRGPTFVKLGSRVFYPTHDLEAYVAANRHEPATQATQAA
jgi:hypothetical protein